MPKKQELGPKTSFLHFRSYFRKQNGNLPSRYMLDETRKKWRQLSQNQKHEFCKRNLGYNKERKMELCKPAVDPGEEKVNYTLKLASCISWLWNLFKSGVSNLYVDWFSW